MTTDLAARVAYAVAKARHQGSRRQRGRAPIVVFSMAKTGSSALAAGLRTAGVGPVHHVHDLDPALLEREEAEYRWSGRPWRIWDAQHLLSQPRRTGAPWRVVSIVRDPIAQTISAFFQPGVRRGYLSADATVESLLTRFGDRLERLPVRWFETHVLPALGIDVYACDFDTDAGYQIISTPQVELLLLRCEDLAAAPTALAQLLGAECPIDVPRVNVGAEKAYADLYRSFVQALRPAPPLVERAYASRLVQHFYSRAEIDRFRERWSAEANGDPAR